MQLIHFIGGFYGAYITSIIMQTHYFISNIIMHYMISGFICLLFYRNNKDSIIEGLYNSVFFGFIFIIFSIIIQSFIFIMYTYYVSRMVTI